ncbi:MAG: serine hydrolase domain-containing protein [Acidimicrobiales bacterium]
MGPHGRRPGPAAAAHEPGTRTGYHALTYGWLVGELVQRVSGRSLADVVREEIAAPLDLDGLYLGCPRTSGTGWLRSRRSVRSSGPAPQAVRGLQKFVGTQFGKGLSLTRSPVNTRRMINAPPCGASRTWSSPGDHGRLHSGGQRLLHRASLAAMYAVLAGGAPSATPGCCQRRRSRGSASSRTAGATSCW